jgi:uncharacterized protein DUF6869
MLRPTAHELTLVLNWIANAETFDAWEDVDEMVTERPEEAWRLIRDMVDVAPDHLLGTIAAGPLEDLLNRHGKKFVERVELAAATDSRFQQCLRGVWFSEPKWLARRINRAMNATSKKPRRDAARLSKKRVRLIARWFHNLDTAWTLGSLDELLRRDTDDAWHIILLLIRITEEEKPHLLHEIDTQVFSMLIELRGSGMYDQILREAQRNETVRGWIEARKTHSRLSDAWQGLLERYGETSSG